MRLKNRIGLFIKILVSLTSFVLLAIDFFVPFLNSFMQGFLISFGFAMLASNLYYTFNKKAKEKLELNEKDERIKMINDKTLSSSYMLHITLTTILIIVFGIFEKTFILTLALTGILLVEQLGILIFKLIYNKKY